MILKVFCFVSTKSRPDLPTAFARAQAGKDIDILLMEIGEIEQAIHSSSAESLQDAAVLLRRLQAHLSRGTPARLLSNALAAVERAAAR